jgi:hypothetical protein
MSSRAAPSQRCIRCRSRRRLARRSRSTSRSATPR